MKAMNRILPSTTALALVAIFSFTSGSAQAGLEEGVTAYQAGDLPQAFKEFSTSAEAGNPYGQFNLALMYEQGIGVTKDETQAVSWYEKSAQQGNSNAQYNLGVLYENGRGTPVDFAQANQWYRKAAAQGDALAVGNLGMLYMRGDGVKVDKNLGLALLIQSATMDSSPTNNAKKNIAATRGLTTDMITTAQALSNELGQAQNLLIPLDQYLKTGTTAAGGESQVAN
ncbi:tetratricopeptide repeat protein [Pseudomonas sp. S9]|uniref:tetratricopeptide repeat protein n=1 Tax=Pseudomonas sp. S9 TaxID=686578 RepID=UPI0002556940|nr:tetratricopeptide repeat protein [Pseudomonas sp. S9]